MNPGKIFNFFGWGADQTLYVLPTLEICFDFKYIVIGWLVFRLEIHYDRIGKKK